MVQWSRTFAQSSQGFMIRFFATYSYSFVSNNPMLFQAAFNVFEKLFFSTYNQKKITARVCVDEFRYFEVKIAKFL